MIGTFTTWTAEINHNTVMNAQYKLFFQPWKLDAPGTFFFTSRNPHPALPPINTHDKTDCPLPRSEVASIADNRLAGSARRSCARRAWANATRRDAPRNTVDHHRMSSAPVQFIHSFIRSFHSSSSFIRSFIRSFHFIRSFIRSFISFHSFIQFISFFIILFIRSTSTQGGASLS